MDTNSTITGRTTTNSISSVRYMSVTAMLSAVAFILMFLDFSVPFMPAFIKMDLSELPALIGAFSMGPVCGSFCGGKSILPEVRMLRPEGSWKAHRRRRLL